MLVNAGFAYGAQEPNHIFLLSNLGSSPREANKFPILPIGY